MRQPLHIAAVLASLAAHSACPRCGLPTMPLNTASYRRPFQAGATCQCDPQDPTDTTDAGALATPPTHHEAA